MADAKRDYIPALNQKWLTPLYDPLLRYVMREEVFKQRLISLANPKAGENVLDLGCGTGTLTLMIQKAQPGARVTGLDGDQTVLDIARKKAVGENLTAIRWDHGMSYQLPYSNAWFDLVVSSLVIHHLTPQDKLRTFREVYRVLKPGGRFYIADFGLPHDALMRLVTLWMSRLEQTRDNFEGKIPGYLFQAGFEKVAEQGHLRGLFGPLSLYQAVHPVSQ